MSMEIPTVNRASLTLRAKQPLVDWINNLPQADGELRVTLAEVHDDATAYLIPAYLDDAERDNIVQAVFEEVFRCELEAWWTDESDWPTITWPRFNEWFEIDCRSIVMDLALEPLEQED